VTGSIASIAVSQHRLAGFAQREQKSVFRLAREMGREAFRRFTMPLLAQALD
jgi:hypothetical protein